MQPAALHPAPPPLPPPVAYVYFVRGNATLEAGLCTLTQVDP
jgi:hypothetical protein